MKTFHPFEMEQHYRCKDYDALLHPFGGQAGKPVGRTGRATAFYLGEALRQTGGEGDPARLFRIIEADPLIRAFYPTAAVTAAARLGEIADKSGDMEAAVRWYGTYLEAWSGLDTPLETHLAIQQRIARIKKKLENNN